MQIMFVVDQRAAIIAGIDAPSATVQLEVEPSWLTPIGRSVLAEILSDGNDATKSGITWYDGEVIADPNGVKLRLLTPSIDGLRCAIAAALAEAMDRTEAQLDQGLSDVEWVY